MRRFFSSYTTIEFDTVQYGIIGCTAENKDEAIGKMYLVLKNKFPKSKIDVNKDVISVDIDVEVRNED